MKKTFLIFLACAFILTVLTFTNVTAETFKWIRIGNLHAKIKDNGHQSETQGTGYVRYYIGGNNPGHTYGDILRCAGLRFAVKDWTDEKGTNYPIIIADCPYGTSDENTSTFAINLGEGIFLKRYWRYPPPTITVDSRPLHEPTLDGDEVAPAKVWGTADVMTESLIRNRIGLEIQARVLAWSQANHDDYIIWDYTITNTGNIDMDDDIELPNQTLKDLYIMRQYEIFPNQGQSYEWSSWYGCRPGDSLRITYSYPTRIKGSDFDNFGNAQKGTGQLRGPVWAGEAILHIAPGGQLDDPAQPQMHCIAGPDDYEFKVDAYLLRPKEDWEIAYKVMQIGYKAHPAKGQNPAYMEGTYPNTHHDLEPDQRGVKFVPDLGAWFFWHAVTSCAAGPYTLKPGESIRFVRAFVAGSIDPVTAWQVGKAWKDGKAKDTWPGSLDDLGQYYPAFANHSDLAPTENDQAKDRWVSTGKDSLFRNATAAQWAWHHDYNVPIPPPPPSVTVNSLPDKINVGWTSNSEEASDFAGYRVYRAVGGYQYNEISGVPVGKFEKVFECGKGTANPSVVHSYDDRTAERGQSYYYYVTAFDDGLQNGADFDGILRPLESGHYINRTTIGARLTRGPSSSLDQVRVVPNPFNIDALAVQWKGENDRIMFMGLPPECTIKIYTESGDLIKTLNHIDGSGDESWGVLSQEWSTTSTGQVIVSGIYIAHIETPGGDSKNVKFLVVR